MESKQISDNNILDIICLFQDAIDIITNQDEERIIFSEDDSISVPSYMKSAAKRGLKIREGQTDSNKCCTPTGLARARQLANGEKISLDTVKRIKSFGSRHGATLKKSTEPDSKLSQSLLLWGISPTKKGIDRVVAWADRTIKKAEKKK